MNLVDALRSRSLTVAFCESLTAGLAAATLADTPGASDVLRGGLITYATDLKGLLAGVSSYALRTYGPVSSEVAAGMAEGAREVCLADWGVSLTGVAGPDPQDGHPVGEVWIGYAGEGGVETEKLNLSGTRRDIREAAVDAALRGLLTRVEQTDHAGRCR